MMRGIIEGSAPSMEVRRWDASIAAIVDALNRQHVWFGDGPFSGLVTPSSAVLAQSTVADIERGFAAVWEWFRSWQSIYADLVAVEPQHQLVQLCEWGLTAEQVVVQRRTAMAGSLPHLARLDAVTAVPSLQVAEAQWKGGGEGFLAGIDSTYRALFPLARHEGPLASLVDMWTSYYADLATGRPVVSVVRPDWVGADRACATVLANRGVEVVVATPRDLEAGLSVRNGRVLYEGIEVGALRCDRLADVVTGPRLHDVIGCAQAGAVVLDPPPSYLCAEKLGMALPFTGEFASYFSDDVRRCLIPTVLITDPPDCRALAEVLAPYGGEALATMTDWDDLMRMPRSLRRRLVVKCGSTNPVWNQGGRGVWKLGGPRSADERVWNTVTGRVRSGREAWVLQPYVDQKWPVDLYHPEAPEDARPCEAHTRLLLYGIFDGDAVRFVGGGANFGSFWKVSGKSARWGTGNRLEGSAFCDLRIAPG